MTSDSVLDQRYVVAVEKAADALARIAATFHLAEEAKQESMDLAMGTIRPILEKISKGAL